MSVHLELVNHFNYMDKNGRIFCKRQDKIRKLAPEYKGCDDCPYLFGSLQGMGVECMWAQLINSQPVSAPFLSRTKVSASGSKYNINEPFCVSTLTKVSVKSFL